MITLATSPYHSQQHPIPPALPVYANTHAMQTAPLYPVCSLKLPQYQMYQSAPPMVSGGAGAGVENAALYNTVQRQRQAVEAQNVAPPQILRYYPHPTPGTYHYLPHQMARRSADVNVAHNPHQSHLVTDSNGSFRLAALLYVRF